MAKKRRKSRIKYAVGEGGALFFDLNVKAPAVEICVNGPGMQIRNLILVTSLSYADGYDARSLRTLNNDLMVISHCGHVGLEDVETSIRFPQQSPLLEFGVGSTGMYLNRIVIESYHGDFLSDLLRKHLSPHCRKSFSAGLVPVQIADGAHAHMTNGQALVLSHHH